MNGEMLSLKELELKVYVGIDVHLKSYSVTAVIDGAINRRWTMPSDGGKLASKEILVPSCLKAKR